MLLAERSRNPHNGRGSRASGVSQHLTQQVRVVGRGELVLDDEDGIVRDVTADQIERVAANSVLCRFKLKIDPERLREPICVRKQPWCEVVRLVRPHGLRVDWL